MLPPFTDPRWRGCALDRDDFDHTRMPERLFDALIRASGAGGLLISRYAPDSDHVESIPADWSSYKDFLFAPQNWALEFVLFDGTGRWAVLADADVTVVGADPDLADLIDQALLQVGTSLVALTDESFHDLDPATQPGAAYLLAVSGRAR